MQPAVHRFVVVLQMPFVPVHCVFERHWTHWFVVVLHTGSPVEHAVEFVPLHSTHAPVAMHAGSSAEVHASDWPLPLSPLHAAHVPVAVLQIGLVPTHADVLEDVHWTHLFVVVLHTEVVPVQSVELPAVHCTHAPVVRLQAGNAAAGHAAELAVP